MSSLIRSSSLMSYQGWDCFFVFSSDESFLLSLSGNFYQIHAYVTNKADEKDYDAVSGMLLYAGTDAEVQPNETVSIHGHRYSARTLDLNRGFSEIRADLNGIVEEYLNVRR